MRNGVGDVHGIIIGKQILRKDLAPGYIHLKLKPQAFKESEHTDW